MPQQLPAYDPFAPGQNGDFDPRQFPPPPEQEPGGQGVGSKIKGALGGIFSTLLGWKHDEEMDKKKRRMDNLQTEIHDYAVNPNSRWQREDIDKMVNELDKLTSSEKMPGVGKLVKGHLDQVDMKRDATRRFQMAQSAQPSSQAPPVMPAQPAPSPGGIGPYTPSGERDSSGAPINRLTPPPIPFGEGAGGAAPAPLQNENPAIRQASINGTIGYGGPTAAPVQQPRSHFLSLSELGADTAALEGPRLQQQNRLALSLRAGQTQQDVEAEKAATERRMAIIKADPNFAKLPPLQQSEILMRAMGIQGAVSNLGRPLNLPTSQIHGSEVPEGGLTVTGEPVDRSLGKGKWYRQQQDVNNPGEIRYFEIQPRLTQRPMLTAKGPVLISTDPRGEIVKVINTINGSEITDKALLETIRTSLTKVDTVDAQGNPVTDFVQTPSSSRRVLPGGGGASTPRLPVPPPAGGPAPQASAAPNAPGPRPKPLTVTSRAAAEFAQTIQPHIPRIESLINTLDKNGKLGPILGRFDEFMAGKVGAGDPDYTRLRTDLSMLRTALVRVHARGGNVAMLDNFKTLLDAGKMDAATLRASVGELKDWVTGYADIGKNRPGAVGSGIPVPPPGGGLPAPLPDGGGKAIDDATAAKFYEAAGKDPAKARQLAKDHNWTIQ